MKSMLRFSLALLLLHYVIVLEAQPEILLEGEIRPRFEFRHGFKSLLPAGEQPAAFVEQRSRLHAHFRHDGFQARLVFQDVRIWGNHNQVYKSDPSLTNVYEAWAMAALNERWQVKAGRQELDYDNARILGNLDWAQQGHSHDALLLQYRHSEKDLRLHLGGAWNQSVVEPVHLSGTFYPYTENYKTMQFAWLHRRYSEHNRFSLLLHNDGRQAADSTNQFRQTIGGIGQKRMETWTVGGEFYYQTGRDAQKRPIHAWLLNAFIEKEVNERLRLMIGVDWLTGTDPEDAASRNNSFDPLYGTNHKFYGYMDYFYVGNPHGQSGLNSGLIDVYARALYKTGSKTTL